MKRAVWDITICGAGLIYVALALWVNLYSPLFGLLLIFLSAYELRQGRKHAKPSRPPKM